MSECGDYSGVQLVVGRTGFTVACIFRLATSSLLKHWRCDTMNVKRILVPCLMLALIWGPSTFLTRSLLAACSEGCSKKIPDPNYTCGSGGQTCSTNCTGTGKSLESGPFECKNSGGGCSDCIGGGPADTCTITYDCSKGSAGSPCQKSNFTEHTEPTKKSDPCNPS